jgi:hypothetical protein
MFALDSRKVLIAALLATVLTAPALASDGQVTAQQPGIGQAIAEMSPSDTGSLIVQQSSQTETKAQIADPQPAKMAAPQPPHARQRLTELRPTAVSMRQPTPTPAAYRPAPRMPLMLGVGY